MQSYQTENTFTKESGVPGAGFVCQVGQKTRLDLTLEDRVWTPQFSVFH